MALRQFKVSTRSQFIDPNTNKWVQLGDWRPLYYCYEWHGDDQLLIVSDQRNVFMFGKMIPLNRMPDDVDVKDLQRLEAPGTYWRRRKSR